MSTELLETFKYREAKKIIEAYESCKSSAKEDLTEAVTIGDAVRTVFNVTTFGQSGLSLLKKYEKRGVKNGLDVMTMTLALTKLNKKDLEAGIEIYKKIAGKSVDPKMLEDSLNMIRAGIAAKGK